MSDRNEMNHKDAIDFCIAQNLAKALGYEKNEKVIWELFLTMDIMGFQYRGRESGVYEIFNGLNGGCRDFMERCFRFLGLTKKTIPDQELPSNYQGVGLMLEVDDFYMNYHTYFHKYHHNRYIVLTKIKNGVCRLYDMEHYQMDVKDLKQAVRGAFYVASDKAPFFNSQDTIHTLVNYYKDKDWTEHLKSVAALTLFRQDLEENAVLLEKADFDKLYFFVNKLGGPTQTRKFMNIALSSLQKELEDIPPRITILNDIFGKLAFEWDILGNMFFRLSRNLNQKLFERIYKRLDEIIEIEKQLVNLQSLGW